MEPTATMQAQQVKAVAADEARRESIAEELRAAIRRKLTPKGARSADGSR